MFARLAQGSASLFSVAASLPLRGASTRVITPNAEAVKRPLSGYLLFVKDHYQATSDVKGGPETKTLAPKERMQKLAQMWRAMPNEAKQPFLEKSASQREQFRKITDELATKIPKRPRSSVALFMEENHERLRKENPGAPSKTIFSKISLLWRALTPEQKRVYQDKSDLERARFKREYQAWLKSLTKDQRDAQVNLDTLVRARVPKPQGIYKRIVKFRNQDILSKAGINLKTGPAPEFAALTAEQKQLFEKLHDKAREERTDAIRKYKRDHGILSVY